MCLFIKEHNTIHSHVPPANCTPLDTTTNIQEKHRNMLSYTRINTISKIQIADSYIEPTTQVVQQKNKGKAG